MVRLVMLLGAAMVALVACGPDDVVLDPAPMLDDAVLPTLEPPPSGEGFQMGIDTVAPAKSEIWDCWVGDLTLPETIAISRVVSEQVPGVHHMDVLALSLLDLDLEDGMHDCTELYAEHPALMDDGTFIFASQIPNDEMVLPDGIAAVLPANLRVMIEIHYVNATDEDVEVWSRVNAYSTPMDSIEGTIWGSGIRDLDLNIPAGATDHVEMTRCVMNMDVELVFSSSHTHELSPLVEVFTFDGEQTGELLYETTDWHAPELHRFDRLPVPAGTGFEWRCHYDNPNDHDVNWGFEATDEMCQIGIVHTPGDFGAVCEVVDSSDGLHTTQ